MSGACSASRWTRQAVWAAERGRRGFLAVELLALAVVLELPMDRLITLPADVPSVTLPNGTEVSRTVLRGTAPPSTSALLAMYERFQKVGAGVDLMSHVLLAQKGAEAERFAALAELLDVVNEFSAFLNDAADSRIGPDEPEHQQREEGSTDG